MMTLWEHICALQQAYDKWMDKVCKKYGLKHKELDILLYLSDHPNNATATDIVKKLNFSKSHVSISLRALEEHGLVSGEFQGTNHRTIYLRLNDSASEIIKDANEARKDFAIAMLDGFSEGEGTAFFESLSKVKKNVMAHAKR